MTEVNVIDTNQTAANEAFQQPVAVIIGMPGAGKTHVGRYVANILNLPFVDADDRFEQDACMPIANFFAEYGELAFRAMESQIVEELLTSCPGVVSLGGGAPMTPMTQKLLRSYAANGGKIVYLQADPEEAIERVQRNQDRPLLADQARERWLNLFEQRHDTYVRLATVLVSTRRLSVVRAAHKVVHMIQERVVHVSGNFNDKGEG